MRPTGRPEELQRQQPLLRSFILHSPLYFTTFFKAVINSGADRNSQIVTALRSCSKYGSIGIPLVVTILPIGEY